MRCPKKDEEYVARRIFSSLRKLGILELLGEKIMEIKGGKRSINKEKDEEEGTFETLE